MDLRLSHWLTLSAPWSAFVIRTGSTRVIIIIRVNFLGIFIFFICAGPDLAKREVQD
jgi:hypothetical protein